MRPPLAAADRFWAHSIGNVLFADGAEYGPTLCVKKFQVRRDDHRAKGAAAGLKQCLHQIFSNPLKMSEP